MEVMLKKDVGKLGAAGEVVKVSPGYARNYLIPRGLAAAATSETRKVFEAHVRAEERRGEAEKQRLSEMVETVENTSCTIFAQANPEGHLFGSITSEMIAAAFAADGIELKHSMIRMDEPLKEAGVFPVGVELLPGLTAKTRVWIIAK